jgi:hypothetical protein
MFGSVPDWEYFFEQAYTHIKPGGWLEIVEHSVEPISDDDTVGPDHFFTLWGTTVIECGEKVGKSFRIWKEAKDHMARAGFVDIVEVPYKWPMNDWPADPNLKEVGRWNQLRLHDGIEGFMLRLLTAVLHVCGSPCAPNLVCLLMTAVVVRAGTAISGRDATDAERL